MNTLLHICCAPCANQCIDVLRSDHYEVTGFWYNPNIHPFTEYRSRRNCLREYAQTIDLKLIEKNVAGEENTAEFNNYDDNVVMMMYDSVVIQKIEG